MGLGWTRRGVLAASTALAAVPPLLAAPAFDAEVGTGKPGAFPSVGLAIAAAPAAGTRPFRILIGEGTWLEKLVVDRPFIHLIGADRQRTRLRFDAAAGTTGPDGQALGTWGCAAVTVRAPDFAARTLTFENGFDYLSELARPTFERIGSNGAQAVALMLDRGADRTHLVECDMIGHQDTLFVDQGSSLFERCRIAGSVDFIFGAGRAWFEACELHSRFRPLMQRNQGWVAVPSTPRTQAAGLVFQRCRLTCESQVPPASVALGRPWRPARSFADGRYGDPSALGMAGFLHCWMDAHISADGWDEMGYADRDGSRLFLRPAEARLREFASNGPGAFSNARRPQLNRREAAALTRTAVLDGWQPEAL